MKWDVQKILLNIRNADTDDLLDRVTAYRAGMEANAVEMIEAELLQRGVDAAQIAAHRGRCARECLFFSDGAAKMCSLCRKPAVREGWGWHSLWKRIPLFPRRMRYCPDHDPERPPVI